MPDHRCGKDHGTCLAQTPLNVLSMVIKPSMWGKACSFTKVTTLQNLNFFFSAVWCFSLYMISHVGPQTALSNKTVPSSRGVHTGTYFQNWVCLPAKKKHKLTILKLASFKLEKQSKLLQSICTDNSH